MKFFKTITGIRAIDDGQEFLIQDEWKEVSEEEANLISNPPLTEEQRVQNINSYIQSIITKKYPLEKQSSANLGIYGDEYKNEMISFISNCINLSNEAIEDGTSFEDYKAMLNEY